MLFFQIKFHMELTCPSNSHNFSWFILTWEEGRLKKGELRFCLIYQIHVETLIDVEGMVTSLQDEKNPQSPFLQDGKLQWEGRSVTLCCLFCVMKMCWCNGHSHPSPLDFVIKRRALPLRALGQKLPEIFCSPSAGGVIAGCAQSMHPATTQANPAVKMLIFMMI